MRGDDEMTMSTRDIHSKAYGTISIQENQIVHFPRGLYGFEDRREYALLDSTSPPFFWLQSLEDPELAFIAINPYIVARDYVLDISEDDLAAIGSPEPDNLLVFAIVTVPEDRSMISCNLQGTAYHQPIHPRSSPGDLPRSPVVDPTSPVVSRR
jgi:flagellar assembly factor FliW